MKIMALALSAFLMISNVTAGEKALRPELTVEGFEKLFRKAIAPLNPSITISKLYCMKTVKALCQFSTNTGAEFFSTGEEVNKSADHIALIAIDYRNGSQIYFNLFAMLNVVDPNLTQDELLEIPKKTILRAIKGTSEMAEITKNGITYHASFKKSTGIAFLAIRK